MLPHVILVGITSDDVYAWLPDCIEFARQELALHPMRPQPIAMIPHRVPMHHLFRFARKLADWYVGIYEALPETSPPFGSPLLLLGGSAYRSSKIGEVGIFMIRDQRFPLVLPEIAWELEERFSSVQAPGSPLAPYVRPDDLRPCKRTGAVSTPDESNSSKPASHDADAPEEARPLKTESLQSPAIKPSVGAPPLACNLWLESQLELLPNPYDYGHLFAEWLMLYIELRGEPPADPRRSFNRAAESILRRRNHR